MEVGKLGREVGEVVRTGIYEILDFQDWGIVRIADWRGLHGLRDFGDFCLPSSFVRKAGVWILRSEDANWKVCGTNRTSLLPLSNRLPASVGNRRSFLQKR